MLATRGLCIDISKPGLEALLLLGVLLTFEYFLSPDSAIKLPVTMSISSSFVYKLKSCSIHGK